MSYLGGHRLDESSGGRLVNICNLADLSDILDFFSVQGLGKGRRRASRRPQGRFVLKIEGVKRKISGINVVNIVA